MEKPALPAQRGHHRGDAGRRGEHRPRRLPTASIPARALQRGSALLRNGLEPTRRRRTRFLQPISAPQSHPAPLELKAVKATGTLRPVCRRCQPAPPPVSCPFVGALPEPVTPPAAPGCWKSPWECHDELASTGPVPGPQAPCQDVHGRVPSANVCLLMGNELPLAPKACSLRKTTQGLRMTSYCLPGNVLPDEGGRGSIKTAQCMYLSPCVNIPVAAETS